MPDAEDRAKAIIKRILDLSEQEVDLALREVLVDFLKATQHKLF